MVLVRTHAAPFAHFERHRAADDVAAGKVLRGRRVAFHEALAFGIGQVTAFAACAFGDQHARAVDAGRVELDELHVLQGQACAQHHAATVTGAGVGAGRGVVAAAIAAGRQHHSMRAEPVDRAVIQAHRDHADAAAIRTLARHDQVDREIFDEEVRVVLQALLVERVEHRVPGTVGGGAGALHRRAFAHVLHVAAEGTLVDRTVLVARKGHACVLQLVHRLRGFAREIFDRVLVAQPVRPLHGVVHVPGPVVGRVVAEAGGDTALRGNRVRTRREDLGDVRGLEAGFGRAHRRAQARSARTHDDHVELMIDDRIGVARLAGCGRGRAVRASIVGVLAGHQAAPAKAMLAMQKMPNTAPATATRLRRAISAKRLPPWWI